ncbi:sulfate ABC transporter substrate-binding protein [Nocardioides daejeonensis]|uniref:sulfate ABC transporter substrate-binding protein n=1 Tax=Nocardioides daejeonensis TaxID=1046556 RepID=UPI000D74B654|nr:sulfate ABC transporter substrate-binding protein [Nocardioides daejeonensis]
MKTKFKAAVLATVLAATAGLAGCSSSASDAETISIVGFAVPEAANKAIADQFKKTDAGKDVRFKTSYGASGDQSRAVEAGLDADYVHFSVASDVTRLVDAGLVADDWDQGANKGIVSRSIVVFGVREGNPKNIRSWEDLTKPGVEIVTPNPASSGAARWNALAAWGQVASNGGSEKEASAYLDKFFANVVALPGSGRDATTAFLGGTGDVLMAYENEAILAAQNGQGFDYVIPETTLLIENPGAVLEEAPEVATAWLDFVLSDEGQKQFALKGFRPIRDDVDFGGSVEGATDPDNPFPPVSHLLTVADDFGSWSELSTKFFDEESGIVTQAIAKSGKAS